METTTVTLSGKVRDRIPETPVEQPTGRRRRRAVPQPTVVHTEALGVEARDFAALPTGLWNEMTSILGAALSQVAQTFDDAFKRGGEEGLPELLQTFIPQVVFALGRGLMEALLRQVRGFYGSTIRCHECGGSLTFEGYIERTIKTKLGPIQFSRAYYHGECSHSAFPLDSLLGLDGEHGMLPDLQECAALLASTMSYPQALDLLHRMLPVGKLSLRLEENVTRTVASEFAALQREEAQSVEPGWRTGEELEDRTVVAAVDGGMCRVRDHAERYREFKLAVVGELGPGDTVTKKSYVATFDGPNALFDRAVTEYVRKRCDRAARLHFVSDGAEWIARRVDELAHPGQTLTIILDWYHATERVKDCANDLFGAGTAENIAWYESMKSALYDENLPEFFAKLRESVRASASATDGAEGGQAGQPKSVAEGTLKYFDKRRKMLCYKACRDQGLPIGSGMVEGGIRFVGKDRLDCTGMRWGTPGAENILQLRSLGASGRWDEFSQMQANKRAQRFSRLKTAWLPAA